MSWKDNSNSEGNYMSEIHEMMGMKVEFETTLQATKIRIEALRLYLRSQLSAINDIDGLDGATIFVTAGELKKELEFYANQSKKLTSIINELGD